MTTVSIKSTERLLRRKRAKAIEDAYALQSRGSIAAAKWEYGYVCAMDYALERLAAIRKSQGESHAKE